MKATGNLDQAQQVFTLFPGENPTLLTRDEGNW